MNELIDTIFDRLLSLGADPRLIVTLIAAMPVAEARLAIPVAIKCGLTPLESFSFGFIGSSLPVPILLAAFIPLIKKLAETRLMHRIGETILNRIDDKAAKITGTGIKRMAGVGACVALPLPLTGGWTGSAVATVLDIGYVKALVSVTIGNLIASGLVTIITTALSNYVNIVMAAFTTMALITVAVLLIKMFRKKKTT